MFPEPKLRNVVHPTVVCTDTSASLTSFSTVKFPASQIARLEPIMGSASVPSLAGPSVTPAVTTGPSAAIGRDAGRQADNTPAVKQPNSPLGPARPLGSASVANAKASLSKARLP